MYVYWFRRIEIVYCFSVEYTCGIFLYKKYPENKWKNMYLNSSGNRFVLFK